MGTIYRHRGKWYVSAYVNGERVRRAAGNKWEAKRLLEEVQALDLQGPVTLAEVIQAYLTGLRVTGKRSSVEAQCSRAQRLYHELGPTFDVSALTVADLEAYAAARVEAGASRATINNDLRLMRAALGRAVEAGKLRKLPCRVKLLKETKRRVLTLSPEEVGRLLSAAREPMRSMLLCAVDAGLRHGEILHLQVADVGEHLDVSAKPGVWSPKDHEERSIPLTARLREALQPQLRGKGTRDWVFPGLEGGPRRAVTRQMQTIWKAAGLYDPARKPGLHQLRRTWATTLLGHGNDIETVRRLGGWSDLKTVQRYVGTTDERMRAAIASIEA